jgi:hypothetical protein
VVEYIYIYIFRSLGFSSLLPSFWEFLRTLSQKVKAFETKAICAMFSFFQQNYFVVFSTHIHTHTQNNNWENFGNFCLSVSSINFD